MGITALRMEMHVGMYSAVSRNSMTLFFVSTMDFIMMRMA
jgi:hypothetical protein